MITNLIVMNKVPEELTLSGDEIQKEISIRLKRYSKLNFFEKYAMFMGKAQILELGFKKLLAEKFGYNCEIMEKWTLGKTTKELKNNNLRADFIILLDSIVDYRNYIAHEILVDQALMRGMFGHLIPEDHYSKESRILDKAIIELEQITFLFDWTEEQNGWDY